MTPMPRGQPERLCEARLSVPFLHRVALLHIGLPALLGEIAGIAVDGFQRPSEPGWSSGSVGNYCVLS